MTQKLLLGQLGMVAFVWLGMAFFLDNMDDRERLLFYIITSWLLFLIVLVVKNFIKRKKEKSE